MKGILPLAMAGWMWLLPLLPAFATTPPELDAVCGILLEDERLPTRQLASLAGSDPPWAVEDRACAHVLKCVLETRRAQEDGEAAGTPAAPTPAIDALCAEVAVLAGLSTEELRELLKRAEGRLAEGAKPPGLLACHDFLRCLFASSDRPWKEEFERICAQTEVASSLPDAEVSKLIEESAALLKRLEAMNDSAVKVYVFRLRKCREFFEYVLQLRGES